MSIFSIVSNLFKPAADLVDNLHTSTSEKQELRNELAKIQAGAQKELLSLEQKAIEARATIIQSEVNSKSAFTRLWRPICSTVMVIILLGASFGLCSPDKEFYELAKIFLSVYGTSRGCEKLITLSKFGK